MPVGKVFNAAENQVLISPVTSYYQGKAIRQELEEGKLDIATKRKELDQMDEELDLKTRQIEAQEKNAETNAANLEQRIDEYADKVGQEKALEEANTIIGITEGAKGSDDPLAYANERMTEFIATLPDGDAKSKLEKMNEDGFQAEELKELYAFAMAVNKKFSTNPGAKSDYTLGKTRYSGETNEPIASNEGEEDDEPVNFEPLNSGERATIREIVENHEKLGELDEADRIAATEMIANDIRQLQANMGKSYAEALKMALAGTIEKIVQEKGKYWGTNPKLDIEGEYEYQVDGVWFIRKADGNIVPRG